MSAIERCPHFRRRVFREGFTVFSTDLLGRVCVVWRGSRVRSTTWGWDTEPLLLLLLVPFPVRSTTLAPRLDGGDTMTITLLSVEPPIRTPIYPQEHLLHKGHFSNKDTLSFPKNSSCIKDTSLTSTLFGVRDTSLTRTLFCVWIRGARK